MAIKLALPGQTREWDRHLMAVIASLGLTQIIGYGTLYYAFSILASDMAADLGWSVEWVFGVLSAALLAGGLMAPWIGIWIDRFGAGRVMTLGSGLAAVALIACATATNHIVFVIALIAIEITANLVQYAAAFALLVQKYPLTAQRSITYLTLIGGFASTIFWPITTALHAQLSWQNVYYIFAAINLLVCLPIHAWLARGARQGKARIESEVKVLSGRLVGPARHTGFVLMVIAFALQSLVASAILVHMVPLLSGLGLGATAALVGTLFGPAQVLSRLTNMVFGGNLSPVTLATVASALMCTAIAVLNSSAPSVAGAITFAILFGLGNGLFSIVAGTLPLVLFGSQGYGRLQGKITSARLTVSAVAPFALAFGMINIGIQWALAITMALGAGAIVAYVLIMRLVPKVQ
ncbi:MAG: arsenite efflux MFS transporter ArsK [Advenella sp.]|uniref:arsenite efflux MFS transporter ArsK n=1 Tax=unclassified Advenella TaxID=2685285 RepID=UPI001868EDB9|nr:arsenite efflux MFS transporter ArsK [Advenella sp. FME57]